MFTNWISNWISKLTLSEINGSFGDIGTFISYTIPLSIKGIIKFPSVLLWSGLFNIITGYYFDVPLPIQPQSTLSSIAIIDGSLTANQFVISGFLTGLITGFLGLTNMLEWLSIRIPKVCIYAIQTGLGLSLLQKGIKECKTTTVYYDVILYTLLLMIGWREYQNKKVNTLIKKIPTALLLFLIGIVISINQVGFQPLNISFPVYTLKDISTNDWRDAFIKGTLSQLPVTLLNSVISTVEITHSYFPSSVEKVSLKSISASIFSMNCFTFLSNLSSCMGVSGVTSQVYMGAKCGMSMIILGITKVIIAVFCGTAITTILQSFPVTIMGVMLGYSGLELIKCSLPKVEKKDMLPFIVSVGVILTINTYIGFLVAWVIYGWLNYYHQSDKTEEHQEILSSINISIEVN
jgi:hypothetical protein